VLMFPNLFNIKTYHIFNVFVLNIKQVENIRQSRLICIFDGSMQQVSTTQETTTGPIIH
jgi:hypothetical protein